MARTETQLRVFYGAHPEGGKRCTDDECVQCEMRDLFEKLDSLRGYVGAVCGIYERVITERHLLEPTRREHEEECNRLTAIVERARKAALDVR